MELTVNCRQMEALTKDIVAGTVVQFQDVSTQKLLQNTPLTVSWLSGAGRRYISHVSQRSSCLHSFNIFTPKVAKAC